MPPRLFPSPVEMMRQSDRQQSDEKVGFEPVFSCIIWGDGSVIVESLSPPSPVREHRQPRWGGRAGEGGMDARCHSHHLAPKIHGPFADSSKAAKRAQIAHRGAQAGAPAQT